jgi:N utilization substance protein A
VVRDSGREDRHNPWTQETAVFISKALSPASVEKVAIDEEEKTALVIVSDTQLSLAIGKKGQNVRLAAKLTGWKIDIYSETEYDKMTQKDREKEIEEAIAREIEAQEEEHAAEEQASAEEEVRDN